MGISAPLIKRQLKVSKSTVYDTIKRYKKLGNNKDCPELVDQEQHILQRKLKPYGRGSEKKTMKNNEVDGRKSRNLSKFYAFHNKKRPYKYL